MTDEIKFKNQALKDAVEFTQQFATDKYNNGYITPPETSGKQTVYNIQQSNILIAMVASLHYKVQSLSIQIERLMTNNKINDSLDTITENIKNLSLDKKLKEPPKPKKIIYFGDKIPGFEGKGTPLEE